MRRFAVPTAALLAVALSTGALAATTTAPAAATKATAAASNPKAADCLKQWKAQKKHTQTRKAFMATCEKA
jgi:hypothetical protein